MSFVDGETDTTLKLHLTGAAVDPFSYRGHFGLPSDDPMTAPSCSEQCSALAKSFGLGQQRGTDADAAEKVSDISEIVPEKAKKGRGRLRDVG